MSSIPFNQPHLTGKEPDYIRQALASGKLSGNGPFTQLCHEFFEKRYGFSKCLLTSSGTDALEMAALLAQIKQGDEVIMPSYTFPSAANAFVLRGAKVVFCDSRADHPGLDEQLIESLITPRTRAIVPMHYAGVACDMDKIMEIANRHQLLVIEDAAQALDSFYLDKNGNRKPLGSVGHLSIFSFHDTKNITCGEGGMLVVNDPNLMARAEVIWEKGTNRSAFMRHEVKQYEWIDVGSSFLPSEITAALLWAQLQELENIQAKRMSAWRFYNDSLRSANPDFQLPVVPHYAEHNAHTFYIVCSSADYRKNLMSFLADKGISAYSHYLGLHQSPFYLKEHASQNLPISDHYTNRLLRLPLFCDITREQQEHVVKYLVEFAVRNNQ